MLFVDNIYPLSAMVELFAALIMAVLLLGCLIEHRRSDKTDNLFIIMLGAQALLLMVDAIIWLLLNNPMPERIPMVKGLTLLTDTITVTLCIFNCVTR